MASGGSKSAKTRAIPPWVLMRLKSAKNWVVSNLARYSRAWQPPLSGRRGRRVTLSATPVNFIEVMVIALFALADLGQPHQLVEFFELNHALVEGFGCAGANQIRSHLDGQFCIRIREGVGP